MEHSEGPMPREERVARVKARMTQVNRAADAVTRALDLPKEAKAAVMSRMYGARPSETNLQQEQGADEQETAPAKPNEER